MLILYSLTSLINIKNVRNVGIAEQQKTGKQGKDDSTKQFNIQPHPHRKHALY